MKKREKKPKSKTRKALEWTGLGLSIALIAGVCFLLIYPRLTANKNDPYAPTKIGNYYLPLIVQTDSMEPEYPTKSAIFIKSVDVQSVFDDYQENISQSDETKMIPIDLTFKDDGLTESSFDERNYIRETFGKTNQADIEGPMKTMTHRLFYLTVNEEIPEGQGRYHFFVSGINDQGRLSLQNQYQVFTEKQLYGRVVGCSKAVGGIYTFVTSPWGLIILILIPTLYMIISSFIDLFKKDDEAETASATDGQPSKLGDIDQKNKEKLKKELLEIMLKEAKEGKEKNNEN